MVKCKSAKLLERLWSKMTDLGTIWSWGISALEIFRQTPLIENQESWESPFSSKDFSGRAAEEVIVSDRSQVAANIYCLPLCKRPVNAIEHIHCLCGIVQEAGLNKWSADRGGSGPEVVDIFVILWPLTISLALSCRR